MDLETKSFLVFWLLSKLRFKYYSSKQIQRYQQTRIQATIKYAMKHSSFFKKKFKKFNIKDFTSLPTTNKKEMMENLTEYNTVGLTKEEILDFALEIEETRDFNKRLHGLNIGMSSGTSGNKGVEILSKQEERYMKAALFARFDFPKGEKLNIAFILRVSAPAFNINKWGNKLTYISLLNPIDEIRTQLEKISPNVLSAPPSMLKLIAQEIENKRLSIKPKRVVAYAEVLYPEVKEYLVRVFKCPIHEIYKATEGPIAMTCEHGNLHINEDLVYVETLNADGTPTPPGKACRKLLVTDLHKRTQPIIRFELNDIITISPHKCTCGSNYRVIEKIQGRSDDIFWAKTNNRKKWQFIMPDYIRRAIITSSEIIDEYQAIQRSQNDILIRIKLKKGYQHEDFDQNALTSNINKIYEHLDCRIPKIDIKFESPKPNINSKKLIRIRREFDVIDKDE